MKPDSVVVTKPQMSYISKEEFIESLNPSEQKVAELCKFPNKDIYKSFREILDEKMNTKIGGTKHV